MVAGIVTIVGGEGGAQIQRLWTTLRAAYGEASMRGFSLPHLTYHVAQEYEVGPLEAALREVAADFDAFDVPMGSFAVIVGEGHNVTCLAPVRTPRLSELHAAIWKRVAGLGSGVIEHYGAERWRPHVTLAYDPVIVEEAPRITAAMRAGQLPTTLHVDNLSLVEETDDGHDRIIEVPLRAA